MILPEGKSEKKPSAPAFNIPDDLTNLPADYDVYLYDSRGKLIESSTKDGQTDETIVLNETKKKERYTIYISGKKGSFDAKSCYTLKLNYKKF